MQEKKPEAIVPTPTVPPTAIQTLSAREEEERALVIANERRDEAQIIAEMDGEILDEFYYEMKVKGVIKRKMLYAGIKEVARRMGNITVEKPEISVSPFDEHYMILRIVARDEQRNYTTSAMVEQCLWLTHTDNKVERDEFAVQKGTAKVIRNVLRALIPEAQMLKHINEWAEAKKGKPALPTPAAREKSQRDAAVATIKGYSKKSSENNQRVWTILSLKGYGPEDFPGWDELSEEHLAYVLTEVNALIDAEAKAGKDAFTPAGKLNLGD